MEINERLRRIQFLVMDVDGVLTDGRIWYDGDGRPFRALHARDAAGLTLWHLVDGKSAFVSGLGSKATEAIAHQWRIAECHMWIKDKARVCRELAAKYKIPLDAMAFLGDDIIDIQAMQVVGLGVAVADAMPEAKEAAGLVLDAPGGGGAIRELVHRILNAQGRLQEAIDIYINRKDHQQ